MSKLRIQTLASVLVLLATTVSCSSVPTADDLTGMWASTQAGATSTTFCFGKDGSVSWISQAQGRTKRIGGTFKLTGEVLTIESQDLDAPATLHAKLRLGKLKLSSSGSTQEFGKAPGGCDDNGR